jgi:nicotinamidase-related amidase
MTPATRTKRPSISVPAAGSALILIDVINDLAFPGAGPLIEAAEAMAPRLARFKARAARAGVPCVYVNDNFGQWRSDFKSTVAHCTAAASKGRRVSKRLRPTRRDYFVLKPMHSGFYSTALEMLLRDLQVRRVILTGIAGNICVLFTASDAHMRGLRIYAPGDCIVSNTADDNESALQQIKRVMKGRVEPSTHIRFV